MIGALIIVFREVLEAALVIGVVAAAVQGLPHRGRHIGLGVLIGICGALLVAASLGVISRFAQGHGQEILQVIVLLAAGLMLAWHNIYMARHGREMAHKLKTLGHDVVAGSASVTMLIGVTAIAVMREGSEVALFLYALAAGGSTQQYLVGGSLIGLAAGVSVGFILFIGLSRIPVRRLFQVSSIIILFIAAGMIARSAQFLIQIGWLPTVVPHIWDTSSLLTGHSIIGLSLSALAGYTPSPSLMQVLVWLVAFIMIAFLMFMQTRDARSAHVRKDRTTARSTETRPQA